MLDWLNKLTSASEAETTQRSFDEYQFEDNRSEVNEDNSENIKSTSSDRDEYDDLTKTTVDDENIPTSAASNASDADISTSHSKEPLKSSTKSMYSDENIFEMTKNILNEDTDNDFVDIKPAVENESTEGIKKVIEETNKIFNSDKSESIDDEPSTEINNSEEKDRDSEFTKSTVSDEAQEASEEDPVNKAFTDLMSDLDKLEETWDKLQDSKDESENIFNIGEDAKDEKLSSLEDDDYEEIVDSNLDKLFENNESDENFDESDENIGDDINDEEIEVEQTTAKSNKPIQYLNDALVASEPENKDTSVDAVVTNSISSTESEDEIVTSTTARSSSIDDLSSAEVDKLMDDFSAKNQKLMQISADDARNAQQVRLTVDTPVEFTSPLYPRAYPTNQIVDWMFTGNGMGIELNITDFAINSHVGDYVLVKPGKKYYYCFFMSPSFILRMAG